MNPGIKTLAPKKLIGKKLQMTFAGNKTVQLWQSFMPRRKEIVNNVDDNFISMQVYPSDYDFNTFNPNAVFEKWAAVEVIDFNTMPEGMEMFDLAGGLYAVFLHNGSSTDNSSFVEFFTKWLPASAYEVDLRPHFEILGKKYKNNDPLSEETICIPVRLKV